MIILGAALMAAAMIFAELLARSGLGGEGGGSPQPDFYWTILNDSTETIAVVVQQPDPTTGVVGQGDPERPEGHFGHAIPPGEDIHFHEGFAVGADTPGGCFNDQDRWVVRSRSGDIDTFQRYEAVDDSVDDLEVVWHIDGGTCTDQENLVWHYDGERTSTTSG